MNQRVAMWISGMYQIDIRDIVTFNWDVAMMPIGPAGRVARLWPDSFAIPKDAKHKEAAWEFIKYVVTRNEMDRYIGSRKVPVLNAVIKASEAMQAVIDRAWAE